MIATLAESTLAGGAQVVVVSTDKDLAQLVREDGRAVFCDFARELTLDAGGVRTRFGVDTGADPGLSRAGGRHRGQPSGCAGNRPQDRRTAADEASAASRTCPTTPMPGATPACAAPLRLAARFAESQSEQALRIRGARHAASRRAGHGTRTRRAALVGARPSTCRGPLRATRVGGARDAGSRHSARIDPPKARAPVRMGRAARRPSPANCKDEGEDRWTSSRLPKAGSSCCATSTSWPASPGSASSTTSTSSRLRSSARNSVAPRAAR